MSGLPGRRHPGFPVLCLTSQALSPGSVSPSLIQPLSLDHRALGLAGSPTPAFIFLLSSARALCALATETLGASVSLRVFTGTMGQSS